MCDKFCMQVYIFGDDANMKSNEAIDAFLTLGHDTRLNASHLFKEVWGGLSVR